MKKGFTLIELLIVVLIIGILSAIAIPMYQGAVDKSHWSTMLPGAKAIKDAEEAFKMSNDGYTDTMANLDVTMENNDLTFNLITPNNTSDPNVIRVTNSKLANVRLASYLDDNPKFAGQLHCEALTGDERANRLCGGLLQGQELTSADGYTGYLLDQSIDKATCDNANRVWSNKQTSCYKTEEERCVANGMPYNESTQFCGYENQTTASNGRVIEEGASCQAILVGHGSGCNGSTIKAGGKCESIKLPDQDYDAWTSTCSYGMLVDGGVVICNGGICGGANTYTNGGICVAMEPNPYNTTGCHGSSFNSGSICYANVSGGCNSGHTTYDDTSCCCGNYCGNKPKCSDRGIACDPQYLK